MKKVWFSVIMVVAMLATIAAAPNPGKVILLSTTNDSAGPTFTFSVSGKYAKSELSGDVHVIDGSDYQLYCNQPSANRVVCNTSRKVGGKNVTVVFGGASFWAYVPVQGEGGIIDWNNN